MIKKKIEKSCALFMILLTSIGGAETETILKQISSQITEIEATEKKIENINNFLDEISKKETEQKLEKLANLFDKKKNELLKQGLGEIKEEAFSNSSKIKNFIKTFKDKFKKDKTAAIEELTKIVFKLDGSDNETVATSKNKLEKLTLNLNSEEKKEQEELIINEIIEIFKTLLQLLTIELSPIKK